MATSVATRHLDELPGRDLFQPEHAERIAKLTAADLVRIGGLAGRCVTFAIDGRALEEVFRRLDEKRARDELIERCVRHGAPRAMMQTFFGLSRHRYSRLRSLLAMPGTRGRPPRPSEALEAWLGATRTDPAFPLVYNNIAVARWHRGEYDAALASLDRAEQLGVRVDPEFRSGLVAAAHRQGERVAP